MGHLTALNPENTTWSSLQLADAREGGTLQRTSRTKGSRGGGVRGVVGLGKVSSSSEGRALLLKEAREASPRRCPFLEIRT